MAYVYRIDGEFGCIFAKWRGVVTLADNEVFFTATKAPLIFVPA